MGRIEQSLPERAFQTAEGWGGSRKDLEELMAREVFPMLKALRRAINGPMSVRQLVAAAYQTTLADELVPIDTGSGAVSVTLPVAAEKGTVRHYVDASGTAGTNAYTVFAPAGETIEGEASYEVQDNYGYVVLVKITDTVWIVLASQRAGSVAQGGRAIVPHAAGDDTALLLQLNETLADTSGNGFDVTLHAGERRHCQLHPGITGVRLFSNVKYIHNVLGTILEHRGDMTIALFMRTHSYGSGGGIISYDTNSAVEAGNYLWSLSFTGAPTKFRWGSEHGNGTADNHDVNTGGVFHLPEEDELVWLGATRTSNEIQIYQFGLPWGAASTLTAPTGGTASRLFLGWENQDAADVSLASIRVDLSARTAAEMKAIYNASMGQWYGELA